MAEEKKKTGVIGAEHKLEKPLEETILYDNPDKGIARITLNRPEKHNCWYLPDMDSYFCSLMDRATEDDDVKVIIITGNGPSFTTGDDLNRAPAEAFGLKPGQKLGQLERIRGFYKIYEGLFRKILYSPKNTIAAVDGYAIGIGFAMAEYCDLVIATDRAIFSQVEQRIGFGGFTNLVDILHFGPKRARELMLTGGELSAEKAKEWGLVNSVVPPEKLEEETMRWAKMITLHSADGLMIMKALMQQLYEILGIGAGHQAGMMAHSMFTNLAWREGEMNFLKLRTEVGVGEAFKQREAKWAKFGF